MVEVVQFSIDGFYVFDMMDLQVLISSAVCTYGVEEAADASEFSVDYS